MEKRTPVVDPRELVISGEARQDFRLNLEARAPELMERKRDEVLEVIQS